MTARFARFLRRCESWPRCSSDGLSAIRILPTSSLFSRVSPGSCRRGSSTRQSCRHPALMQAKRKRLSSNGNLLGSTTVVSLKEVEMHVLNIVASPRKEKSASAAIVDAFLSEYKERAGNLLVDTLDIWQERLPEFDAEAIDAKYKGVSGESMTPVETATWEKIRELASRFQRADRIVLGVPMWNFSVPYKLKQLIDLSCQRNMLFTFDGEFYGPSLSIDKAFVAYVRGQSDAAGFKTVSQPGFEYLSGYVEFWLRFIGVRSVVTLTVEHSWDGRAVNMIDAGKRQAVELARQF